VEDDSQSNPSETTEEDELTMAVENENGSIKFFVHLLRHCGNILTRSLY